MEEKRRRRQDAVSRQEHSRADESELSHRSSAGRQGSGAQWRERDLEEARMMPTQSNAAELVDAGEAYSELIKVQMRYANGWSSEFEMSPEDTLRVLKQRLFFSDGIPPSSQSLCHGGAYLVDESLTMTQMGIQSGSVILVSTFKWTSRVVDEPETHHTTTQSMDF